MVTLRHDNCARHRWMYCTVIGKRTGVIEFYWKWLTRGKGAGSIDLVFLWECHSMHDIVLVSPPDNRTRRNGKCFRVELHIFNNDGIVRYRWGLCGNDGYSSRFSLRTHRSWCRNGNWSGLLRLGTPAYQQKEYNQTTERDISFHIRSILIFIIRMYTVQGTGSSLYHIQGTQSFFTICCFF